MQAEAVHRILILDDHEIFSNGLCNLLDLQPGLTVCGQVFHVSDALPVIQQEQPHLILLDINLPDGVNGIDLGKIILANFPDVRLLILTIHDHRRLMEDAQRSGMHGYLLKDANMSELLRAIHTLLNGGTYYDPRIPPARKKAPEFTDEFTGKLDLSERELEVVSLVRQGLTNGQIAGQLSLSADTVKTHRKKIHRKLNISKVTELIQFAIRHGI